MGAQLRVYKRRIRSVTATKKITKAMEMISASRIVKAQRAVAASTPYADELTRAVTAVATRSNAKHPLTTENPAAKTAAVLLITADRGLAGGYSTNAIKQAVALTARLRAEGKDVVTYIVGRKGVQYYGFRNLTVAAAWTGFSDKPMYGDAKAIASDLIEAFTAESGGVDELHLVSTRFESMLTQTPVDVRLLPLKLDEVQLSDESKAKHEIFPLYDFEPSAEGVLDALLPRTSRAGSTTRCCSRPLRSTPPAGVR